MITVELSETEALSLLVAARAVTVTYEEKLLTKEEAYLELVKGAEKLENALWGPINA